MAVVSLLLVTMRTLVLLSVETCPVFGVCVNGIRKTMVHRNLRGHLKVAPTALTRLIRTHQGSLIRRIKRMAFRRLYLQSFILILREGCLIHIPFWLTATKPSVFCPTIC